MMETKSQYKLSEIGEIPVEWEVKEIGEVFKTIPTMSLSRKQTVNNGDSYYLHYGDIHKKKLSQFDTNRDISWLPMINKSEVKVKEDAKLFTGDVVFADASEDLKDIGKNIVVINGNNSEFYSGLHTISIRESEEKNKLDTFFKGYCFKNEQVKKQIKRLANGTTVYGISKPNLLSIKFAVPILKEQQKIAEILSTVDEQIEQTDQLIEKTTELKKGLMQQLLTKGVGHTKFKNSELGEIPIEWKINKFYEVTNLITCGVAARPEYVDEGIPFLSSKNIKKNKIVFSGFNMISEETHRVLTKYNKPEKGDILYTRVGSFGEAAVIEEQPEFSIFVSLTLIKPIKNYFNSYFLSYLLNSDMYKKLAKRGTTGLAVQNLNVSVVRNYPIITPPIKEQQKIAEILSSVDDDIEGYQEERATYLVLKKGLMQQLLTGKTRVKVD